MSNIHIPTKSINLKDVEFTQLRVGLQGDPASGKTFSAMTFPFPVVCDFDGGLNRFAGYDIIMIPFYSDEYVQQMECGKSTKPNAFANRRDAFLRWLQTDGLKLTKEQTLIIDSWTSLQNAFDLQQDTDPAKITKGGEVDDFYFWQKKIEYCEKIVTLIKACKCHVVITFHEDKIRDKNTGQLIDKLAPLMQGKFVAQIKSHFTDFLRCIKVEERSKEGKTIKEEFFWQVKSDLKFDAKTKLSIPDGTILVEPNFSIFEKYSKPISSGN